MNNIIPNEVIPNEVISANVRDLLNDLFNVIAEYDLINTDHDFSIIEADLKRTKKETFLSADKYIIAHDDTDYYLPGCEYGLGIYNLVKAFISADIPLSTMIFVTNRKGVAKEFERLLPLANIEHGFPIIIDDCMMCFDCVSTIASKSKNIPLNAKNITKHAMCLMGSKRVHRNIIFNFIKQHALLKKIITAYANI